MSTQTVWLSKTAAFPLLIVINFNNENANHDFSVVPIRDRQLPFYPEIAAAGLAPRFQLLGSSSFES